MQPLRFRREPRSQRKRGILAITDKTNGGTPTAAIRDLWQSDAVLSELVIGGSQPWLRIRLSTQTGAAQRSRASCSRREAFQQSVHYLRSGYAMYYTPPPAPVGSQRKLQVALTPEAAARFPNVRVRARAGYVVRIAP